MRSTMLPRLEEAAPASAVVLVALHEFGAVDLPRALDEYLYLEPMGAPHNR